MDKITIKLVGCPEWRGRGRKWRKGEAKELPGHIARQHLDLFQSPFVEVKKAEPSEDKMMRGAPENKSVSVDSNGKPQRESQKPKKVLSPKGWRKKK